MVKGSVISVEDHFCVVGCGEMELTNHLFVHCSLFGSLWYLFCGWLLFSLVDHRSISDHLNHYAILRGSSKARHSFLHLIWFTCVWVIWQEQNDKVLNYKENLMHQLLNQVKYLSLWWLKYKAANVYLELAGWWQRPLDCLIIG